MLAICRVEVERKRGGGVKGGSRSPQLMEGVICESWKPDSWRETVSCPLFSCLSLTTLWACYYFLVTWNQQRSKPLTLVLVSIFLLNTHSFPASLSLPILFLHLPAWSLIASFQYFLVSLLSIKKKNRNVLLLCWKEDSAVYKGLLYVPLPFSCQLWHKLSPGGHWCDAFPHSCPLLTGGDEERDGCDRVRGGIVGVLSVTRSVKRLLGRKISQLSHRVHLTVQTV